ncbi:MAG: histidine phosphatase family protein [Nitrospirae bacterium]|nr:histidine phosphatase family protein [Nitrospirota bacterium]
MVTTLYLIRHGETEGSETKRYKGSIDVPLSENGIRQVEKTSAFVAAHVRGTSSSKHMSYLKDVHGTQATLSGISDRLKAVYTSDLGRAVKSGEIIATPHGIVPIEVPELRERSFGIWEGMSFTEIREQYPEEFNAWAGNPLKYSPVDGESTLEVKERAIKALDKILSGHDGECIAVVAHGGVNRIILCHVLGIPFENIFRIEQDYAAVNIIEFWDKYPVVKLLNGGMFR